jgi:hypothetical protein
MTIGEKTAAVLKLLHERAERLPDGYLQFTGSVTEVFKQAGAQARDYSIVRNILVNGGYVTYLTVGNKSTKSTLLLTDLSEHPFDVAEIDGLDLTRLRRPATMILRRLENQVADLIEWRESLQILREVNIGKVFQDFEERLTKLEGGSNAPETGEK